MSIDTEIKNAVSAADQDAQYDDKAKRLLGNKIILAHILVKTVDEFRGMNPKEVVSYIEGEPLIGHTAFVHAHTHPNTEYTPDVIIVCLDKIPFLLLIGIANELPEHDEKYELHRLLSTLLSMELTVDEKLGIIEKEYGIVVDDRIREDVSAMCNLSQGIKDNTLAEVIMTIYLPLCFFLCSLFRDFSFW